MSHRVAYRYCRDAIKSGDLLLWTHPNWWTWKDLKIQFVRRLQTWKYGKQMGQYTHAGIALVGPLGRVWVIESVHPLIRMVPLSNLLPASWCPVESHWDSETTQWLAPLIGTGKYSEFEAMAAAAGLDEHAGAWECAKLYRLALLQAGREFDCLSVPSALAIEAVKDGHEITDIEV